MYNLKKITKCPVCGGKKIYPTFKLKSIPLADNFSKNKNQIDKLLPITPLLCNKCSHLFLKHYVDQNENYKHNFSYKTQITKDLKQHFEYEIRKIIKENKLKRKSLCLDIGSNDGTILSVLKQNKMQPIGIEPSISISKYANTKGLKTINSFFDHKTINFFLKKFGKPKMIITTYTFANIKNIKEFLQNIKKIISYDGILVIETGYHPKQMANNMFDYFYHEHFSYFSLKSMKYLLESVGFQIIKAKITDPKSGSLLIVSKIDSTTNNKFSVTEKKILLSETKKGIYKNEFYKNFSKRISFFKKKLHTRLNILKKNGEKIIGYGASHSCTLLLHQFELNKYLDFIVDDNKIKHFKYSPNHKIPVFPTNYIYDKKVKNIILLAWNKKKYIVKKHQAFLKNKGKFLLPF